MVLFAADADVEGTAGGQQANDLNFRNVDRRDPTQCSYPCVHSSSRGFPALEPKWLQFDQKVTRVLLCLAPLPPFLKSQG